ncbi:MAG: hypothetical protein R3C26_18760 [Calditrichia bacterium]
MTAIPGPGYDFSQWTGNVFPPNANPVNITMNSDQTVIATFVSNAQVTLTVDTLGLGFVTLDPEPSANGTYDQGTMVTITATARPNWEFVEWFGDVNDTQNPSPWRSIPIW